MRIPRGGGATAALIAVLLCASGCGTESDDAALPAAGSETPSTAAPAGTPEPGNATEPELRAELVAMLEEDQAERSGEVATSNDRPRAERLREIVERHGWPTYAMVGEDGATAAWAIAQHADHDVALQKQMLDLMSAAVDQGEADPSQLAFLTDRVAINNGRPQVYGSQMGCVAGEAVPGPIEDEANVDDRRAAMGLEPLADYLAQFDEVCAAGN